MVDCSDIEHKLKLMKVFCVSTKSLTKYEPRIPKKVGTLC